MKKTTRLMAVILLATGWTVAGTQRAAAAGLLSQTLQRQQTVNPYSRDYQANHSHTFGTYYVEYNPHTWHVSTNGYTNNTSYQGISLGFNYFVPFFGSLGFDAGLKGQYLFRSKKENGIKNRFEMFSATIPVDLVYDWRVKNSFAINPYVGIYGRYNFSAKTKNENGSRRTTVDWFKEDQVGDVMNRFQVGWQLGVNFRISDMVTIGGAYWMDFSEVTRHTTLRGFNITLGANF